MAEPKRRHSRSRRDKRRSHDGLTLPNLVPCSHCHKMILPHRICPSCGYYKGRSVIPVVEKAE